MFIHHGADDENAPLASITDLAERLPQATLRLSDSASHAALAEDEAHTELGRIFREVAGASSS